MRYYGQRSHHLHALSTPGSKLETTAEWGKQIASCCTCWILNNALLFEPLPENHAAVNSRSPFQNASKLLDLEEASVRFHRTDEIEDKNLYLPQHLI